MVKHFTIADWVMTVNSPQGQKRGIQIVSETNLPDDLIIQVYEALPNNEFQLIMFKMDLGVTVFPNSILIFGDQPFNGKVVIK